MVALLAFTGAACSDDSQHALDTVAPTTTRVTVPTASTAVPATTTSLAATTTTTVVAATTTVPGPVTPTTLALTDGPWHTVTSIPEVVEPGLYYELSLPELYAYFPAKVAPDDRVFWTLSEADRPIIEAYLNAQLTIHEAMLTRPMDFNLDGWDRYFEDGGTSMQGVLRPRSEDGLALNMDLGYVMRPWVIENERTTTTAIVVDCVNNGALLQHVDGSLAPSSSPGWFTDAYAASMVLVEGRWTLRALTGWEDACTVFGPPYAL